MKNVRENYFVLFDSNGARACHAFVKFVACGVVENILACDGSETRACLSVKMAEMSQFLADVLIGSGWPCTRITSPLKTNRLMQHLTECERQIHTSCPAYRAHNPHSTQAHTHIRQRSAYDYDIAVVLLPSFAPYHFIHV